MDWKLELIVVPVSDVDRAKAFYVENVGFALDVDHSAGDSFRVVQMTPVGSACSIAIGKGLRTGESGSVKGLQMVVEDIEAARAEFVGRGVDASDFFYFGEGGQTPGLHPAREKYGTFFSFDDPDGNAWLVQEVKR